MMGRGKCYNSPYDPQLSCFSRHGIFKTHVTRTWYAYVFNMLWENDQHVLLKPHWEELRQFSLMQGSQQYKFTALQRLLALLLFLLYRPQDLGHLDIPQNTILILYVDVMLIRSDKEYQVLWLPKKTQARWRERKILTNNGNMISVQSLRF